MATRSSRRRQHREEKPEMRRPEFEGDYEEYNLPDDYDEVMERLSQWPDPNPLPEDVALGLYRELHDTPEGLDDLEIYDDAMDFFSDED